jgi:hypothetical protein
MVYIDEDNFQSPKREKGVYLLKKKSARKDVERTFDVLQSCWAIGRLLLEHGR